MGRPGVHHARIPRRPPRRFLACAVAPRRSTLLRLAILWLYVLLSLLLLSLQQRRGVHRCGKVAIGFPDGGRMACLAAPLLVALLRLRLRLLL